MRVHTAHKGRKLRHVLNKSRHSYRCSLNNCKLNNDLCLIKGAIYEIKCISCGANYIGSSWRHLHTRYREHLTQRASPIYSHNLGCRGQLAVEVLAMDSNIQRMRIKEAILIKKRKPSLNGKEDILGSHILFS